MESTIIFAGIIAVFSLLLLSVSLHLWLCKITLNNHDHVNTLEKALPVHASLVQQLIQELSNIAGINTPDIFVYRAALPNAFVAAMPLQANLYIADELFEEANDCNHDPLQTLANTLAHEIAHLKLQHAFAHAMYTYVSYIHIPAFSAFAQNKLKHIENEADIEAEKMMHQFNQPSNHQQTS